MLTRIRGTAKGGYRDGVLEGIGRRQAESLARTAVQHFSEAARERAIQENADLFQGILWNATLDRRTTRTCQLRDGLVWDLDHRPVGHSLEWLDGPGRAHWGGCRSTGVPVLKEYDDLLAAGIVPEKLGPQQRAALDGPVPATTSFEDWLRDQEPDVQADALDSAVRAEEFRAGKPLAEVWDQRFDRKRPRAPRRG